MSQPLGKDFIGSCRYFPFYMSLFFFLLLVVTMFAPVVRSKWKRRRLVGWAKVKKSFKVLKIELEFNGSLWWSSFFLTSFLPFKCLKLDRYNLPTFNDESWAGWAQNAQRRAGCVLWFWNWKQKFQISCHCFRTEMKYPRSISRSEAIMFLIQPVFDWKWCRYVFF